MAYNGPEPDEVKISYPVLRGQKRSNALSYPIKIGRNNFFFAGSHKGAERLALIYSLIGTCKLNDVNPYEWLKDVLDKLNSWPINKIHEPMPHNWKRNKYQQPTT